MNIHNLDKSLNKVERIFTMQECHKSGYPTLKIKLSRNRETQSLFQNLQRTEDLLSVRYIAIKIKQIQYKKIHLLQNRRQNKASICSDRYMEQNQSNLMYYIWILKKIDDQMMHSTFYLKPVLSKKNKKDDKYFQVKNKEQYNQVLNYENRIQIHYDSKKQNPLVTMRIQGIKDKYIERKKTTSINKY